MSRIFKRFGSDILGVLWLAAGVFLGSALWSFHPADPSFNSMALGATVRNWCGYVGSFSADLLFQGLGLAAWAVVIAALRNAWVSFTDGPAMFQGGRWLWALLLLLSGAGLFAIYFPEARVYQNQILVGGWIGSGVAVGLQKMLNATGALITLWAAVIVLLIFFTEKSISEIAGTAGGRLAGLGRRLVAGWRFSWRHGRRSFGPWMSRPKASGDRDRSVSADKTDKSRAAFFPIPAGDTGTGVKFEVHEGSTEIAKKSLMGLLRPAVPKPTRAERRSSPEPKRQIENWTLPSIQLLEDRAAHGEAQTDREIKAKAERLMDKLEQFSIGGEIVGVRPGPAVTLFEFKPNADVKISKITELEDDLCLALSSESVRIIAPIPGRDVVGIETSNRVQQTVYLKDNLLDEKYWDEEIRLPIPLGRSANGETKVVDLRKMPHLLVAGTTGSGKSVFVVSFITALICKHSPKTLKMILIDPKQVDLSVFSRLPHLIMPVIREPKKAVNALNWAIREMDKRYRSMARFGARGLESFNAKVGDLTKAQIEEHELALRQMEEQNRYLETYYFQPQPYVVIVVEEFGDLMAVDKNNVEQSVVRLAQMARACGIHLLLAMQSPRRDVVTGLIKTNIPGRISFKVASKLDSRVILDESGAERLLARGDMLFLAPGVGKPERHHGAWVTENEIQKVVDHWSVQGEPLYEPTAIKAIESGAAGGPQDDSAGALDGEGEAEMDERYDEIVSFVGTQKEISASMLQRRFRLGYPRAARLIEILEAEGVVGPANGSKPRRVLVGDLAELDT